jgi:hypothetical protein
MGAPASLCQYSAVDKALKQAGAPDHPARGSHRGDVEAGVCLLGSASR